MSARQSCAGNWNPDSITGSPSIPPCPPATFLSPGGHPIQVSHTRAITHDGPSVLGSDPYQCCDRLRPHVVQDRGEYLWLQAQHQVLPDCGEHDEQEGMRPAGSRRGTSTTLAHPLGAITSVVCQ